MALLGGMMVALLVAPLWAPGLWASLAGDAPKVFWYLSRASAWVAYGMPWLSMVFGLLMTNKTARAWPGGPVAFDLHQHTSLLGLAIAMFHALILLGDRYTHATIAQILVPFTYQGYRPAWVGAGQISLYLMLLITTSFWVKRWIGRRAWRLVHFLSFVLFALALAHGIWSGSDTGASWAQAIYWGSGGTILFLTIYRVLLTRVMLAHATVKQRA